MTLAGENPPLLPEQGQSHSDRLGVSGTTVLPRTVRLSFRENRAGHWTQDCPLTEAERKGQ